MRVTKQVLIVLLVSSILFLGLMSCSMGSDDLPEQNDPPSSLTAYTAVDFSDLDPLENPEADAVATFEEGDAVESMLLSAVMDVGFIGQGLAQLMDDESSAEFESRSMNIAVLLQFADEHFAITDADNDIVDLDIKHLDILFEGGINSLTAFIENMLDSGYPSSDELINGSIGLSTKALIASDADMGGSEPFRSKSAYSGSFKVELSEISADNEGNVTGLVDASLNFSMATNLVMVYDETEENYNPVVIPAKLEISLTPIEGVDITALTETEEPTWENIKSALWGNITGDCIVLTITYIDEAGSTQQLQQLQDGDVLNAIMGLFPNDDDV